MTKAPASLIINSPYQCPDRYWEQDRDGKVSKVISGRRPAAYEEYDTRNNTKRVQELETVNLIRTRLEEWRNEGYPGITGVTRSLLDHWHNQGEWDTDGLTWIGGPRSYPFYFCQIEAVESLIWWLEAPENYKQGIALPGDGGPWERICNKMATGTGKTTLMALIITWQVLNAATYPKDKRFSKAIFVVAPGLTVKSRLQVLNPGNPDNVYDEFDICPNETFRQKLNQLVLGIENWHTLMPQQPQDRSVVKKGIESEEAFTRRVLGRLSNEKDLVIINDEAHHAYRQKAELKVSKKEAQNLGIDLDEATRWIEGLDRIHKTRRIRKCFDLTATPFAPTGKSNTEKGLFEWIISDFGLNDAIEAGLVKTPRIVVRDDAIPDAKTYASKLYHLYREEEVKADLNRPASPDEPLPDLVQKAYALLAYDWKKTSESWRTQGHSIPPVLLTVCNRTETASRIEHFFNSGDCLIDETHDADRTLRVDSKVLEKAERGESASKNKNYAERLESIIMASNMPMDKMQDLLASKQEEQLRALVDTVGKRNQPGQNLKNVISVAMLSEGWDAANVTHIMGLRAFTSQLLCEQVIGRGLRRVSHDMDADGRFLPEYVNVFGVPLSVFQQVSDDENSVPTPRPSIRVEVEPGRNHLEISWPNIERIQTVLKPELVIDWDAMEKLTLNPSLTPLTADIAPSLTGLPNLEFITHIDLEKAVESFRLQEIVFRAARKLFLSNEGGFEGHKQYLAIQLIRIVEAFMESDKFDIPSIWHNDPLRRRLLFALNMDMVVAHVNRYVTEQNIERYEILYDEHAPKGSTAKMRPWQTTKPCRSTKKSQISHVVYDSTWEKMVADICEEDKAITAWAKNDHLNFRIRYLWRGSSRNFLPDYLIRLKNGKILVLEVKGKDSEQNQAKRQAMNIWITAINEQGGFGQWCFDTVFDPSKIRDTITKYS
jgi:type III restriction enzyme